MNTLLRVAALAAAIAMPLTSFAQTTQPVTRAQVKAELVQLEKAGYHPWDFSDTYYPDNIQAAEAKVAAQNQQAQDGGYGPSTAGASQSGRRSIDALTPSSGPAYDHH
ncbi:Protein of unknown function (DUF4148) (plasmid) [Paraburkholderia caribensis MBA4]|uniref:Purine nucleoside phosphorylase n=1 Tax=Paraburkholderia caribensis MBA4 TaxID=1323664 RepID=A0A0P0RRP9_9BURK|nr:DUF4148 domain-containing protein [Paraburkholderia caribensis]ALL71763.1 Protein of unknown function (DUF4148) [Paraburkholderia caribensis MBA4]